MNVTLEALDANHSLIADECSEALRLDRSMRVAFGEFVADPGHVVQAVNYEV